MKTIPAQEFDSVLDAESLSNVWRAAWAVVGRVGGGEFAIPFIGRHGVGTAHFRVGDGDPPWPRLIEIRGEDA